MGIVTHADGSSVDVSEYNSTQVSLMGKHAIQLLETGPERGMLNGQQWKNLHTVAERGLDDDSACRAIAEHDTVNYLFQHWYRRYAALFGALARIDEQPIEIVRAEINAFQDRVNGHIGNLRYIWSDHTHQNLPLQTAVEQVRWNGPGVQFYSDEVDDADHAEPFLRTDALLPHVAPDTPDLLFDSQHISPSTLLVPIRREVSEAVRKELARYT